MEKKFNFIALRPKAQLTEKYKPYLKISGTGIVHINYYSLLDLGIENKGKQMIKVFVDIQKRALGFQVTNNAGTRSDGYRCLTMIKEKNSDNYHCTFSVSQFVNALETPDLSQRLEIDTYKDKQLLDNDVIYYVIVPKKTKDLLKITE